MPASITFRPQDGAVLIDGCPLTIGVGVSRDEVLQAILPHYRSQQDHKNGYEWLYFDGFSLGGKACSLGFCFFRGCLQQIHWAVTLPNEELEGGWPTRQAIDNEITFVRTVLSAMFDRRFASGEERFPWGVIWADFDARGFQASAGLRYSS